MGSKLRWHIAVVALSLVHCQTLPGKDPRQVAKEVSIAQDIGGYRSVYAELGVLPLGQQVEIKLTIHNPGGETVNIGKHLSGCSCVSATVSSTEIEPRGTAVLNLKLETPSETRHIDQRIGLWLSPTKSDPAAGIQLTLAYMIEKLIAFRDEVKVVEVLPGDSDVDFKLPLEIAPEVDPGNLQVRVGASLRNAVRTTLQLDAPKPYLLCELRVDDLRTTRLSDTLEIVDRETNFKSSLLCHIVNRGWLTIAPQPIRFRLNQEQDEAHASILVRLAHNDGELESENRSSSQSVGIAAVAEAYDVKVTKTQVITPNLVRAYLSLSKLSLESEPKGSLFVSVEVNGRKERKKVPFLVTGELE